MAPIEQITAGCHPLYRGNDGDFWTDATGQGQLRTRDGQLRNDADTLQCPVDDTTAAVYISPGEDRCESFRTITAFTAHLRAVGCAGDPAPADPHVLLSLLMRPLVPGTHDDVVVRIAATVDAAQARINGASGTAMIARYTGRITVRETSTHHLLNFQLHIQNGSEVVYFPADLIGEYAIPRSAAPFGARLTTLPFTLSGQGPTARLRLAGSAADFVQLQLQRLAEAGLRGPRFAHVRTLHSLALALQTALDVQSITRVIDARIAAAAPATAEFVRTQLARLRQHGLLTPRFAAVTTLRQLALALQVDLSKDAITRAITERIGRKEK